MQYQKIRGYKRRHRDIEKWRVESLQLRLDLLEEYDYVNTDVVVHPWCNISLLNSDFPEPRRKTKQLMLDGLVDIYYSWKEQLSKFGKPYYLKIWLCEPRFSKSQIVCAIGDRIDYYENLFFEPAKKEQLRTKSYGRLKNKLDNLNWEHRLDEDHIANDYVGEPQQYLTRDDFEKSQKWFVRTMKKPHRTTELDNALELYSFTKGDLWLGSLPPH
jgi:hypothetical protein